MKSRVPTEPVYYRPGEIDEVLRRSEAWRDRVANGGELDGAYRQVEVLATALATAMLAVDALADVVAKATDYGTQDGDFVASYLLPTGPIHRSIPLLEQRFGVTVRPRSAQFQPLLEPDDHDDE